MKLLVNGKTIDNVAIIDALDGTVQFTFKSEMTVAQLEALFAVGSAPEVEVKNDNGVTVKKYFNKAVRMLAVQEDTAIVGLKASSIAGDTAQVLQDNIDAVQGNVDAAKTQLGNQISSQGTELNGKINDTNTRCDELDEAVVELASIIEPTM